MNTKIAIPAFLLWALSVSTGWSGAAQESAQENQPEEITVPEGTVIPIVLTAYLNTRSTQVGDTVYADTTYPIWIQQRLIIPKGSTIRGTITDVVKPGKIMGKGRLAVRFDDILLPNGVKREFVAAFRGIHGPGTENIDRKSETVAAGGSTNKGEEVGTVVATTGEGAIIGAVVGHGSGALIGGGAGAAAGIATVLFTRDRNLVLSPGTLFDLELKKPMKFAFNEIQFTDSEINRTQRTLSPNPAPASSRRRTNPFGRGVWLPGIPILLF